MASDPCRLCDSTKLRWVVNLEWYFTSHAQIYHLSKDSGCGIPGPQVSLYIPCPKISPNQKSPEKKKKMSVFPSYRRKFPRKFPRKFAWPCTSQAAPPAGRPRILNWNCGPSERTVLGAAFPLRCPTNFGGVDCVFWNQKIYMCI